jgi:hypothetical protein
MDEMVRKKRHQRVEIKNESLIYNAFPDWGVTKRDVQ